ncbi:hypothetical protein WJX79_006076 [Trebouxia sp. C0005]
MKSGALHLSGSVTYHQHYSSFISIGVVPEPLLTHNPSRSCFKVSFNLLALHSSLPEKWTFRMKVQSKL